MEYLPHTNIKQLAKVKVRNQRFSMPLLGDAPKVANLKDIPIYPSTPTGTTTGFTTWSIGR